MANRRTPADEATSRHHQEVLDVVDRRRQTGILTMADLDKIKAAAGVPAEGLPGKAKVRATHVAAVANVRHRGVDDAGLRHWLGDYFKTPDAQSRVGISSAMQQARSFLGVYLCDGKRTFTPTLLTSLGQVTGHDLSRFLLPQSKSSGTGR